nr:hypothetical protein [uncultured Flavobacterium sp.]
MKYIFFVLLVITFSRQKTYSQNNASLLVGNNITNRDSIQMKLEVLYEKLILSQSYEEMQKVQKVYFEKVHFKAHGEEMINSGDIKGWVNANIDKTEFKGKIEANKEYKVLSNAIEVCSKENKSYYDLLAELLTTVEGSDIWQNAIANVAKKYPEKFQPDPLVKLRRMLLKQ